VVLHLVNLNSINRPMQANISALSPSITQTSCCNRAVMQVADRTYRLPLRWRILLYSSAVLVILIACMLVYVNFQAHRFVTDRISADLTRGRERISSTLEDEFQDLSLTARLVASIPALKALLGTDLPTIKDFLLSYQQQNQGPDLLIVFDANGQVVARTDSENGEQLPNAQANWVKPALSGKPALGMLPSRAGLYSAAVVPAEAGGMIFGFVMAGSKIDAKFANKLRQVSEDEIVIVKNDIIGSTLPESVLPWRSRQAWASHLSDHGKEREVRIGGELYAAVLANPPFPNAPAVIFLQSQDKALAPYRRIQMGLLVLGLLATSLGVVGSAMLARRLTAPIAKLVMGTREVAAGNFSFRLDIVRGDEIGDLAQAFNKMTEGLRERADMQKFVSRSTIEMIQSSAQQPIVAGQRKLLTVLFSDIRGFTALSERQEPEQVVNILNEVFSLQTERIKKFAGDIDKFVGDAVLAFFQGEDAPLNAVRCAVEINKALEAYNRESGMLERIDLGIGIATGEVILGSIGSEDRRDFTVIGSHVNLCARLCSLARPREILLSESTYGRVRDLIAAERLPPQHVKGFSEEVPVYKMAVHNDAFNA
jgi:class 3 adenylate cyclase